MGHPFSCLSKQTADPSTARLRHFAQDDGGGEESPGLKPLSRCDLIHWPKGQCFHLALLTQGNALSGGFLLKGGTAAGGRVRLSSGGNPVIRSACRLSP